MISLFVLSTLIASAAAYVNEYGGHYKPPSSSSSSSSDDGGADTTAAIAFQMKHVHPMLRGYPHGGGHGRCGCPRCPPCRPKPRPQCGCPQCPPCQRTQSANARVFTKTFAMMRPLVPYHPPMQSHAYATYHYGTFAMFGLLMIGLVIIVMFMKK